MLKKWENLPPEMQTEEVRKYYDILKKKQVSLFFKRMFDIVASSIMLIILSPAFLILAIAIKIDSKGPVFYRQVRVTQYNKQYRIFKFRSMCQGADKGTQVTVNQDARITRVGKIIRKYRLDEISQLFNVLSGDMTFVATRAEVPKYTVHYTKEMMASLLLPAGVTSLSSILYKDEAALLNAAEDVDTAYVEKVLPGKMYYNLKAIENFSFWGDIKLMFMTFFAVLGKEYQGDYVAEEKESGVGV
ncbi:MAG: sugar transferase [Ruminococcaceae bacterium]|nr:sugar transferase [Oscillospiraceae bacterium]